MPEGDQVVRKLTVTRCRAVQKVLSVLKTDPGFAKDRTGAQILRSAPLFVPDMGDVSDEDRATMLLVAREMVANQGLYEGMVVGRGGPSAAKAWETALEYFKDALAKDPKPSSSSSTLPDGDDDESNDDDEDDEEEEEEEKEEEKEQGFVRDVSREPKTWAEVSDFLAQEAVATGTVETAPVAGETGAGAQEKGALAGSKAAAAAGDEEAEETYKDALGVLKNDQVADLMRRIVRAWVMQGGDERSCTVDITSDNFDPALYLATLHAKTPFSVLRGAAVRNLGAQIDSRAAAIKTLVRQNFDLFVKCKDAIDLVHGSMRRHEFAGDAQLTAASAKVVATNMRTLEFDSQGVFDTLLRNQREAEHLRALLFALDKNKYLFKLPGTLRAAAARGDDERVVEVYRRAREMLGGTSSPLFASLLDACNAVVTEYRKQLFAVLEDPAASVATIEEVTAALGQLALELPVGDRAQADPLRFYFAYHVDRITAILDEDAKAFCALVNLPPPAPTLSISEQEQQQQQQEQQEQQQQSGTTTATTTHRQTETKTTTPPPEVREVLDRAYNEVCSHVHEMAALLQQALPQLCRVAKMFGAMDSDDGPGFEELEIEAADGAEEGVVRAAAAVKKKKRLPDAIKYIPAQKHRVVDVLIGNDTWARIRIRKNQTSALFFQQLLDYLRKRCGISAAPSEYGLYTVTTTRGADSEVVREMHPYDKPYQVHKQWTKGEKGYFLFRRRRLDAGRGAGLLGGAATAAGTGTGGAGAGGTSSPFQSPGVRFVTGPEVVTRMITRTTASFAEKALRVFLPGRDDSDAPEATTHAGRLLAGGAVAAADLLRSDVLVRHDRALQQCLEDLEGAVAAVRNEGVPDQIAGSLVATLNQLKQRFARQVCRECREVAAALHRFEDWQPTADGPHTLLPVVFSTVFKDLYKLAARVAGPNTQMLSDVSKAFVETVPTFLDTLHQLVFPSTPYLLAQMASSGASSNIGSNSGSNNSSNTGNNNNNNNNNTVDFNEKLQRVLANCLLSRKTVFPDLFRAAGMSSTDRRVQRVSAVVNDLESLCLSHYISLHTARVTQIVQDSVPRLIKAASAASSASSSASSPTTSDETSETAETSESATTPASVPPFAMSFVLEAVHVQSETEDVVPSYTSKLVTALYTHFVRTVRAAVATCPARLAPRAAGDVLAGVEFARSVLPVSAATPGVALCHDLLLATLRALCPAAPSPEALQPVVQSTVRHTSRLFSCFSLSS